MTRYTVRHAARALPFAMQHTHKLTRATHAPILHDALGAILEVGSVRARLDDLVERLEAKAPVAAGWAVVPNVDHEVREEVVLGAVTDWR